MKEMTTSLSTGKITEITNEVISEHRILSDDNLILIEAERLSLNDSFMKHKPRTKAEKKAKRLITGAIKAGVKNFYRPIMDPSFTEDGIEYVAGKKPAVGKSYNWWFDTAKKYDPSHNSRLGTRLEYRAFLGVLIKKLVEEVKSVKWAWNAVCNDSKELGNYWDTQDVNHELELTGSKYICGFYDLANTYKFLSEDVENGGYWLASGSYDYFSNIYPIADACYRTDRDCILNNSVGWIVLL